MSHSLQEIEIRNRHVALILTVIIIGVILIRIWFYPYDLPITHDGDNYFSYALDTSKVAAQYGTATYSTSSSTTQFVYGGGTQPLLRQSVEGSGFTVALKVDDGGETAPYSLKGFQLEYQLGARR